MTYGCKKECNPSCGPLQFCDDGVCSCKADQFLIGNSCLSRCENCFEGSFDCGCTDKYIFNTSAFDDSSVLLNFVITGTIGISNANTTVTKLSPTRYRFLIPRSCDVGDRKSTHIEFFVDRADLTQLNVDARYHILPSNETLATCSAIFTR